MICSRKVSLYVLQLFNRVLKNSKVRNLSLIFQLSAKSSTVILFTKLISPSGV